MNTPKFDIKNLSLSRSGQPVLHGVTIHVNPGEIVGLLGPSGSGKSSLLRCLNRLAEPPPDTVFVGDEDVTAIDVISLRQRVGMVFQKVALFPGSVADNIIYGPRLQTRSLPPAEIERLLTLADLPPEFGSRNAAELSGGQAQRVAIARTLATEPVALLLDEPTSALDPTATRHVENTMLKLNKDLGLTMLWVTHSADQAQRVADRVYLLVDGRVADEGTPHHVFRPDSDHLVAAFAAGELETDA